MRELYQWGNAKRDITSLLSEKRIFDLEPGAKYASKGEGLRKLLEAGKITFVMVRKLPDLGPTTERDLHGSQRRRAQLPLKRTTGEVTQGPRLTHDDDYDGEFEPGE